MVNSSSVGSTTCPMAALRSMIVPVLVAVTGVLATSWPVLSSRWMTAIGSPSTRN
ncbi:MAG: hypothetical protein BWZ09_02680 [Alphaproteobacteria bacterium ADurb.BinA305]|nr:MAG: hypothetical protein BWZ09_02680 [Alphaproteobacteria bacterium ADurb.BinA305]